jgi:hypothetical protein
MPTNAGKRDFTPLQKRICFCAALLMARAAVVAETPNGPSTITNQPIFQVESSTVELGNRPSNKPARHTFQIKNAGGSDLVLGDVRRSCTCVFHSIVTRVIPPGESTEIVVGYEPNSNIQRNGSYDATITIQANDEVRQHELRVHVNLVSSVFAQPAKLDFGTIALNQTKDIEFELHQTKETTPPSLPDIQSESPLFAIEHLSTDDNSAERVDHYKVSCRSTESVGLCNSVVSIKTNSIEFPRIEIPLQVQIPFILMAKPDRILFGVVAQGETRTKTVALTNTDPQCQIGRVECDSPSVRANIMSNQDGSMTLKIDFTASIDDEKIKAAATVYDKENRKIGVVPIFAFVKH